MNRRQSLVLLASTTLATTGFPLYASAARAQSSSLPDPEPLPETGFNHNWLVKEAERLSKGAYERQTVTLPEGFENLNYDQYRDIRFKQEARVWRDDALQFQLDFLPGAFFFTMPVDINLIEDGKVIPVDTSAAMFDLGPSLPPLPEGAKLPLSGFRVRNQINNSGVWDEFLVFQGASYFRAVAKGQLYGLSARGLAVNTAEQDGEEFPDFTAFWIEKPDASNSFMVIHALLESASYTGAYKFTARPGTDTVMDVEATIFARQEVRRIGLGALTTMFLFDSTNRSRFDDFRPAVFDSSGLQMQTGAGEWIWRPLANPVELQVSAFVDDGIRGFGLIQRATQFADFQDLEAKYELRPSLWVEPIGNWGNGAVELFEIPTRLETNDNIVAFWRPEAALAEGQSLTFAYRLYWGHGPGMPGDMAKVKATRMGKSFDGKRELFVIDFDSAFSGEPAAVASVTASAGKVSNIVLLVNPHTGGYRASFELDVEGVSMAELRLQLASAQRPVAETWLYRWTTA